MKYWRPVHSIFAPPPFIFVAQSSKQAQSKLKAQALCCAQNMGAMAKNNPKRKRPRPASTADGTANGGESAWSSIPGQRLSVDIADKQNNKGGASAAAVNEHQESDYDNDDDNDSFDDDAFLNTTNWTSRHFDDDDDDEAFHKTAETEFWDPDPNAKSNKFDATAKMDGAHDDGMFLRLVSTRILVYVLFYCKY